MADLQGNTIAAVQSVTAGISMSAPTATFTSLTATSQGATTVAGALIQTRTVLTYGTTIATNAALGNFFSITVTDGVGFTISAPTNPTTGQQIHYTIVNTSGGAVGTITWDAVFKKAAFTTPATANNRSISFVYNGTNWIELYKTAADVGN